MDIYNLDLTNENVKKRFTNINNSDSNDNITSVHTSVMITDPDISEFIKSESDIISLINLVNARKKSYLNVLTQRKQDVFINSLLISIFCISPIALVPFYYCFEANKQMKYENFEKVEVLLRRANYFNFFCLLFGLLLYICLLSVGGSLLLSFNNRLDECKCSSG